MAKLLGRAGFSALLCHLPSSLLFLLLSPLSFCIFYLFKLNMPIAQNQETWAAPPPISHFLKTIISTLLVIFTSVFPTQHVYIAPFPVSGFAYQHPTLELKVNSLARAPLTHTSYLPFSPFRCIIILVGLVVLTHCRNIIYSFTWNAMISFPFPAPLS